MKAVKKPAQVAKGCEKKKETEKETQTPNA